MQKTSAASRGPGLSALVGRPHEPAPLPSGVTVLANAIINVPLGLIDPSPDQPRRTIRRESRSFQRLLKNIKAIGLLQPVGVRRNPEDPSRFFLRWGGRRTEAFKMLAEEDPEKWGAIPATLEEGDERSAKQRIYEALGENNREDLDALEAGEKYKELIEEYGESYEGISETSGETVEYVKRCVSLANAPDVVKQAFIDGIKVPRLDEYNNPVMREEVYEEGERKTRQVPVLSTQSLTDVYALLELVKLYNHLHKMKPRVAEREFRKHFERAVSERMSFRDVKAMVARVRGGEGKGGEGKGGKTKEGGAEPRPAVALHRLPKGTAFHDDSEQLVVDKARVAGLPADERAALREKLLALAEALAA